MVGLGPGTESPTPQQPLAPGSAPGSFQQDCKQQFGLGHFEVLSLGQREAVIIYLFTLEGLPSKLADRHQPQTLAKLAVLSGYYLLGTRTPPLPSLQAFC